MPQLLKPHKPALLARDFLRLLDAAEFPQRSFGGMEQIKERARDHRGWVWPEQLMQDVRYALRQLWRAKG
ncbi:MAG: hypothetical protein ABIZ49_12815, partial [Opitutaceae bacterium]